MSRRRPGLDGKPRKKDSAGVKPGGTRSRDSLANVAVTTALLDYTWMVSLVFGGCCSNVWAYEQLLRIESRLGPALTFCQMLFITLQKLPSFLDWKTRPLPRLKARKIPVQEWFLQVLVFASGSLLNNLVYAYDVPLTVQIVFRSAGLAVSMLLGRFVLQRRYTTSQYSAVGFVTVGAILATLSRPSAPKGAATLGSARYVIGVAMLTLSLILTGILGILQERTYKRYGPHWQEGVFYTHALSLPMFAFMVPQIVYGLKSIATAEDVEGLKGGPWAAYLILSGNLVSQLICVSGVNQLSSRVSSVSTQVVLTSRKAFSLCVSVWWFRNGWNDQLALGAGMVFFGSMWYAAKPASPQPIRSPSKSKDM